MSQLGQSRRLDTRPAISDLPLGADLITAAQDVSKVPRANMTYSITSSAVASRSGGILKPCALAVLKFAISSNFVGSCTGRSAGFSPFSAVLLSDDAGLTNGPGTVNLSVLRNFKPELTFSN